MEVAVSYSDRSLSVYEVTETGHKVLVCFQSSCYDNCWGLTHVLCRIEGGGEVCLAVWLVTLLS